MGKTNYGHHRLDSKLHLAKLRLAEWLAYRPKVFKAQVESKERLNKKVKK